jgi:regulator of sigma E protease
MQLFITVVAFIVIFSILVLIHECGHFFVAKRAGIKVEEFGFGLPPRIWGIKKGQTLYSVNLIPFGGFVRLLGEDSRDLKLMKNKASYISKPPRVRFMVVVAGVIMNFLLAFLLLTVGFTIGMQPLILSGQNVLDNIENGNIHLRNGIAVKSVEADSPAAKAGIISGDLLISADGRGFSSSEDFDQLVIKSDQKQIVLEVERNKEKKYLQMTLNGLGKPGFTTYELVDLPKVVVQNVAVESNSYRAGLRAGDVILAVNEKPVYFSDEINTLLRTEGELKIMVLRGTETTNVDVKLPQQEKVIITSVLPFGRADKVGLKAGDVIVSIDNQLVMTYSQMLEITNGSKLKELEYKVRRGQDLLSFILSPDENGLVGVYLSNIYAFENNEFSFYDSNVPVSVTKIDDIRYPIWIAPLKALEESGRLSLLTVKMFGEVFKTVFTTFTVPEGVAGPVGIAKLTYVFVQEGILSLVRFMALLSLSLAIINVFPFPALDGGRLLFIILEVVIGRKISPKFEAIIHAVGFFILMLLIAIVTYSDILKSF